MSYELDEWINMYYSPCIGELYGMTAGSTPTTDVSYFMAYPWFKHDTCMQLSCLVNNMRWDRVNGGCVPSMVTGYFSTAYGANEAAEPHCAKKWNSTTSTEVCKFPTADLVKYQDSAKTCWNNTLLNSNVDYLISNFCLPNLTTDRLEQTRIAAILPGTHC